MLRKFQICITGCNGILDKYTIKTFFKRKSFLDDPSRFFYTSVDYKKGWNFFCENWKYIWISCCKMSWILYHVPFTEGSFNIVTLFWIFIVFVRWYDGIQLFFLPNYFVTYTNFIRPVLLINGAYTAYCVVDQLPMNLVPGVHASPLHYPGPE